MYSTGFFILLVVVSVKRRASLISVKIFMQVMLADFHYGQDNVLSLLHLSTGGISAIPDNGPPAYACILCPTLQIKILFLLLEQLDLHMYLTCYVSP